MVDEYLKSLRGVHPDKAVVQKKTKGKSAMGKQKEQVNAIESAVDDDLMSRPHKPQTPKESKPARPSKGPQTRQREKRQRENKQRDLERCVL